MRTLFVFLIVLLSVQIMGVPFAVAVPIQEQEIPEEGEAAAEGEPVQEEEFEE